MRESKPRLSKKTIAISATIGVLLILLVAAFLIPTSTSKGTEKLTGVQKEAAEVILVATDVDGTDHAADFPFVFKGSYIKEVYTGAPRQGVCLEGKSYSDDPNNLLHYGAVVGWRTFFGIEYKTIHLHYCQVHGG